MRGRSALIELVRGCLERIPLKSNHDPSLGGNSRNRQG